MSDHINYGSPSRIPTAIVFAPFDPYWRDGAECHSDPDGDDALSRQGNIMTADTGGMPAGLATPFPNAPSVEDKLAMMAGILLRRQPYEKAIRELSPSHFDPVHERHLAVTWAAAKAMTWPLNICLLRQDVSRRASADPEIASSSVVPSQIDDLFAVVNGPEVPDAEHTKRLLDRFLDHLAERCRRRGTSARRDERSRGANQRDALVELARQDSVEFFHFNNEAFATVPISMNDMIHHETYPVSSSKFRQWLSRTSHHATDTVPGKHALEDAVDAIAGFARFDGPVRQVFKRIGREGEKIYLDLGDSEGRVVEIRDGTWRVLPDSPIKFIRPTNAQPLPVPVRGGSLDELQEVVNLPDEQNWVLALSWLVSAFRPAGPHAVLVVSGEQGSAKSTTCRMLRRLVDPNRADLRSPPRKGEEDLMIAAANGWVVGYDNFSYLSPELSDGLCRLSTGTGMSGRKLYTNGEEYLMDACCPIIINGIEDLATRPDLLERCQQLSLPPILLARKTEAELWAEYERRRPAILGALFTAVATAAQGVAAVKLQNPPRMADFARWVVAAEPAMPWATGAFLRHVDSNRTAAIDLAIEASAIGNTLNLFADHLWQNTRAWQGTATDLLTELELLLPYDAATSRRMKPDYWPKQGNGLSNAIKRLAQPLRSRGIQFEKVRGTDKNRTRMIKITLDSQFELSSCRQSGHFVDSADGAGTA